MGCAWILWLALAQAAGSDNVVLEGTAVDPAGAPVRGAECFLAESKPPFGVRPALADYGAADDKGGFRVHFIREPDSRYLEQHPRTLWLWAPGKSVIWRSVPLDLTPEPAPVRAVLGEAPKVAVRILTAEGAPAVGVRVYPAVVSGRLIPEALAERLAASTNDQGRAVLAGFRADDMTAVRTACDSGGIQQRLLPPAGDAGIHTLRLARAGRVEGRVTAADSKAVRGLTLFCSTKADPSDDDWTGGFAESVTDADGRFAVPAIAEGALTVRFVPHQDLPFRGRLEARPEVVAGQSTRVEVPLQKAARIQGVVKEQHTGKGIAGVRVQLDWTAGMPRVRTDADGKYTGFLKATAVTPYVHPLPWDYFYPRDILDTVPIPPGTTELTAKPSILARGVSLRGRVTDPDGKAVPGTAVRALWRIAEGDYDAVSGHADRHGNFLLPGIDPKADLRLTAHHGDLATPAPVHVKPGAEGPLTIVLRPGHTTALSCRVLDPRGRPIAGAVVRFRSGVRSPRGARNEYERVALVDDNETWRTGADGRVQTPAHLPADREYRAEVEAWGFTSARTEWVEPRGGRVTSVPDVVLHPVPQLCEVSGRVVDRGGKAVAGAVVFQSGDGPHRTKTTTDATGHFRLAGVCEGRAFVFVRADGFRFRGYPVEAGGGAVTLTLDRPSDAVPHMATLPPRLPREEEKALAHKIFAPVAQRLARGEKDDQPFRRALAAAEVDPALALELAERGVLGEYGDYAFHAAAEALLDEAPEEGLALAEMIPEARWRTLVYIKASDRVPTSDRARKKELLDTALLYARSDPSPVGKLDGLGYIARRWLDLGEREKAADLLREGQAYAATLPPPSLTARNSDGTHARGRFAAKLARIDTKGALALAEGFPDPYGDWYIGGVTLGLAEHDPAEAERLSFKYRYGWRLGRLAGRIARLDLPRARKVLTRIDNDPERVQALNGMVRTLLASNPAAAAAVLDEAFDALEELVKSGRSSTGVYQSTCATAGTLLPLAERLGPEHLDRCFWRVLALRPPRPVRGSADGSYETAIAQLAFLLARYDRAAARTVLEPAAGRMSQLADAWFVGEADGVYAAAAVIDPMWAKELVEAIPDRTGPGGHRPQDQARQTVARVLARAPAGRWDFVLEGIFYFRPDSRDDER
jgi:hypothetical protein